MVIKIILGLIEINSLPVILDALNFQKFWENMPTDSTVVLQMNSPGLN